MKPLLVLISHLLFYGSNAQYFIQTYGDFTESVNNIHPLENGGYLLTGSMKHDDWSTDKDVYMIYTDSQGNETQPRYYFGTDSVENLSQSLLLSNGSYAFACNTSTVYQGPGTVVNRRVMLSIRNFDGSEILTSIYAGDCVDMIEDNDQNLVLIGTTQDEQDIRILKVDPLGEIIFDNTYESLNEENFLNLIETDEGYYVCGTISNDSGDNDAFLLHLDIDGNELWQYTYGEATYEFIADVVAGEENDLYLVGYSIVNGPTPSDALVIKCDRDGNFIWSSLLDLPGQSINPMCAEYDEGTIVLTGSFDPGSNGSMDIPPDLLLARVDTTGNYLWAAHVAADLNSAFDSPRGRVIHITPANDILVGGTWFSGSTYESLFVKTNSEAIVNTIEIRPKKEVLLVYPSPAASKINILFPYYDRWQLKMFDSTGKLVMSKGAQPSKNLELDISILSKGIYHLTGTDLDGKNFNSKILVE